MLLEDKEIPEYSKHNLSLSRVSYKFFSWTDMVWNITGDVTVGTVDKEEVHKHLKFVLSILMIGKAHAGGLVTADEKARLLNVIQKGEDAQDRVPLEEDKVVGKLKNEFYKFEIFNCFYILNISQVTRYSYLWKRSRLFPLRTSLPLDRKSEITAI